MNDFESTLVSALRAESQEIAMDVDLQDAATELDERLDRTDRARRRTAVLGTLAAAAAVVIAVAGIRALTGAQHDAQSVKPSPSAAAHQDPYFTPSFSMQLPAWVVAKNVQPHEDSAYSWWPWCEQPATCTDFSVSRYDSLSLGSPTARLSAAEYVEHLSALQKQGILTIGSNKATTVDGHPATELGIATGSSGKGLALGCASDNCQDVMPNMLMRVVVVDLGVGKNPVVLYTETAESNPDAQAWLAQMDAPLTTIRFTG